MQKIPFFELFPSLPLPWEQRMALDGAYLTAAELVREKRTMSLAVTVQRELGEDKEAVERAIAEAYGLTEVRMSLTVVLPKQEK